MLEKYLVLYPRILILNYIILILIYEYKKQFKIEPEFLKHSIMG